MTASIGPVGPRFDDVRRIAVLRGGGLGDLMFVLPAAWALTAAYPDAELVLLGTPEHAALLSGRPGPVAAVATLPVATGVFEPRPERPADREAQEEFFARAKAAHYDLAVQAHGGGRWSNRFLLRLGARHTVGTRTPDAVALDRCLPYRYHQHEAVRWLELAGLAGAPHADLRARLAVTETDRAEAARAMAGLARPWATVHPGATDPRRRWPAEHFAEVAAALVAAGAGVAVVGAAGDTELVNRVVDATRHRLPAADAPAVRGLGGAVSLGGLVGVLADSAVVIANDSGPRHLAEAVGTPTVSVYWCGNMINAGPFGRATHRPHISWAVACPVCGHSLLTMGDDCPHLASWVAEVPVAPVRDDAVELLGA